MKKTEAPETPEAATEVPEAPPKSRRLERLLLGFIQFGVFGGLAVALCVGGFFLFRKMLLERYVERELGYPCEIGQFEFNAGKSMVELRDVVIWNIDPYPVLPLAKVRRFRLEWDPTLSKEFPRQLRLLEIELDELTLVRLDGNKFNILDFVEAVIKAWGSGPAESGVEANVAGTPTASALHIDECWLLWDYLVALDQEVKGGKRMEVLVEYEGYHKDVTSIREITDPAIKVAKGEVDGFYFFNYVGDSLRALMD